MLPTNSEGWVARILRKPERPVVEWFRLGGLGTPECVIGVLRSGDWVVDTADGLADLSESRALTFVLRLLSVDMNNVRDCLSSYLQGAGLDPKLADTFPFVRLVVHAVESGGYWAEQAFGWLQQISLVDSDRLAVINGLKQIESNKDFSQSLRHGAMKQRVQLERKPS